MSRKQRREIQSIDHTIFVVENTRDAASKRDPKIAVFGGEVLYQLKYKRMLIATEIGKGVYGKYHKLRRIR